MQEPCKESERPAIHRAPSTHACLCSTGSILLLHHPPGPPSTHFCHLTRLEDNDVQCLGLDGTLKTYNQDRQIDKTDGQPALRRGASSRVLPVSEHIQIDALDYSSAM